MSETNLNIDEIVNLKRQEFDSECNELLNKLMSSTQSIYHRVTFCEYHYCLLDEIVSGNNLVLDRVVSYRRGNDAVELRFVYEENITEFINNFHALFDSFPYALNLSFTVVEDTESSDVAWNKKFLGLYRGFSFGEELKQFCVNSEFQLLRGYSNTIKHKCLLPIANTIEKLELEEITYDGIHLDSQGGFCKSSRTGSRVSVKEYLARCYDRLIPAYFLLWESIKTEKRNVLQAIK